MREREQERRRALAQVRWLVAKRGGGLTQHELGERLGNNQSQVSRFSKMNLRTAPANTPTSSMCRLIGYIYHERRRELASSRVAYPLAPTPDPPLVYAA